MPHISWPLHNLASVKSLPAIQARSFGTMYQTLHDPGILLGLTDQCIPGIVYLRSGSQISWLIVGQPVIDQLLAPGLRRTGGERDKQAGRPLTGPAWCSTLVHMLKTWNTWVSGMWMTRCRELCKCPAVKTLDPGLPAPLLPATCLYAKDSAPLSQIP